MFSGCHMAPRNTLGSGDAIWDGETAMGCCNGSMGCRGDVMGHHEDAIGDREDAMGCHRDAMEHHEDAMECCRTSLDCHMALWDVIGAPLGAIERRGGVIEDQENAMKYTGVPCCAVAMLWSCHKGACRCCGLP